MKAPGAGEWDTLAAHLDAAAEELMAAVLESQHPTTGLNDERRSSGPLVIGRSRLGYGEPESLVVRRVLGLVGSARGIHCCADGVADGPGVGRNDRRRHGRCPWTFIGLLLGGRLADLFGRSLSGCCLLRSCFLGGSRLGGSRQGGRRLAGSRLGG